MSRDYLTFQFAPLAVRDATYSSYGTIRPRNLLAAYPWKLSTIRFDRQLVGYWVYGASVVLGYLPLGTLLSQRPNSVDNNNTSLPKLAIH